MDIEFNLICGIVDGSGDPQDIGEGPGGLYNCALSEPLAVATIPTRPLPGGCTHAAITSPCCTTNCWDCGIKKWLQL